MPAVFGERGRRHRLNRVGRISERFDREVHALGIFGPSELLQRFGAQLVAGFTRCPLAPLRNLLGLGQNEDRLFAFLALLDGELLGVLLEAYQEERSSTRTCIPASER